MDYYKILGIDKNASAEDIKRAYRRLAHQYHPDRPSGDEKKFKEINEAYQTLSNQDKRRQYDQFGSGFNNFGGFGGFGGGNSSPFGFDVNFEDLSDLGDIFDSVFEGLGIKRRKTYQRGADLEMGLEITLKDAYDGVNEEISFSGFVQCPDCKGFGHFAEAGFDKCSVCDGKGEIRENRATFFGNFSQVRNCDRCFGSGQLPKKTCSNCKASGRIKKRKTISVAVASGVRDGQIIKIAGAGEAGERGASAGDLYIRVKIKPHPQFAVRGDDLLMERELDLRGIIKNEKIKITTLGGKKLELEIPKGADLTKEFRVPNEGMPKFGQRGKGDLYLHFIIRKP